MPDRFQDILYMASLAEMKYDRRDCAATEPEKTSKKPSPKGRPGLTKEIANDYFVVDAGAEVAGGVAGGVVVLLSSCKSCKGAEYCSYSLFGVTIHDGFLTA